MKYIFIAILLMSTQLFANYAINNDNTVKIDMHGGNSEKLTNSNRFSDMKEKGFGGLSSFGIKKPSKPMQPEKKELPTLKDIKMQENDK